MQKTSLLLILIFICSIANAQDGEFSGSTHKIAVFAPLYLDSVFKEDKFQYKNSFPRFTVPGLDFVQGIKISLDSFPMSIGKIEVFVFDAKADSMNIQTLIDSRKLEQMELMLAAVKDKELTELADYAGLKMCRLFQSPIRMTWACSTTLISS